MVSRRQFIQGMGALAVLGSPLTSLASSVGHAVAAQ